MPSFFNGKKVCLTYAQSEFTSKEDLLAFFDSLGEVKFYIISRELHQDGNPHYHCAIEFKRAIRGGCRIFDFQGRHPNLSPPRNWAAWCVYCRKEDFDRIESEEEVETTTSLITQINNFNDEIEWMNYCATNNITFQYATWFWNRCKNDVNTITEETEIAGEMWHSLQRFAFVPDTMHCLVLRGPTGCGKTTWAKKNMPKPCLFVSHIDDLKKFRTSYHKSIIYDDVNFSHYPRESQIHVADFHNPRSIHCRHSVAHIPAGIPKCFTTNGEPLLLSDPAIKRRCLIVNVTNFI